MHPKECTPQLFPVDSIQAMSDLGYEEILQYGIMTEEVFEISDFTAVTDLEVFIAKLETVISDWQLQSRDEETQTKSSNSCVERSEKLTFGDKRFLITHFQFVSSEGNGRKETQEDTGHLSRPCLEMLNSGAQFIDLETADVFLPMWFGIFEFLIVRPDAGFDAVRNQGEIDLMVSAFNVAASNTNCEVPILFQAHRQWRKMYTGISCCRNSRINFDTVHLRFVPDKFMFLAGLIEIFKEKIRCVTIPEPPISISVRRSYCLAERGKQYWDEELYHFMPNETNADESPVPSALQSYPFGASQNPINKIVVSTYWLHITEDLLVENEVYSDFNPMSASDWSVKVSFTEDPQCMLSDFLSDFMSLAFNERTILEQVGVTDVGGQIEDPSIALSRLTEDVIPRISSLRQIVSKNVPGYYSPSAPPGTTPKGPIGSDTMTQLLGYIFPDAKGRHGSEQRRESDRHSSVSSEAMDDQDPMFTFKCAPPDSITHRIALCSTSLLRSLQGCQALSQLWSEISLELRFRWEKGVPLPLVDGHPDLRSCALHQELQMLNCCIIHKRNRMKKTAGPEKCFKESVKQSSDGSWGDWNESSTESEEFFDCEEVDTGSEIVGTENFAQEQEQVPEGRDKQCGTLSLVKHSEVPLFIPKTQDPSPITERMLADQAEVLSALGNTQEASLLRARMQAASLLSDMESFKAANPGCCLEDFVRWFSPRDWVTESGDLENPNGALSERMRIPGNMWVEVWENARSVPASKQKLLFDDTKEAEKGVPFPKGQQKWYNILEFGKKEDSEDKKIKDN